METTTRNLDQVAGSWNWNKLKSLDMSLMKGSPSAVEGGGVETMASRTLQTDVQLGNGSNVRKVAKSRTMELPTSRRARSPRVKW